MLEDQGALINELDWDYLIILDALRYDCSGELLKYFDGELTKVRSRGSSTCEWLAKTFNRWYNLTYISANPFINNTEFPLSMHLPYKNYSWGSWKAVNHFFCIVDVWDSGWNEELGTVPPENVNKECFRHRDDRMIIHYLQPHPPFLTRGPMEERRDKEVIIGRETPVRGAPARFKGWIESKMDRLIGTENVWRVRRMLNLEPIWYGEDIWREEGMERVKYHYQKNLVEVLEATSSLWEQLNGRLIITADHGEGFERISGHPAETHLPELVEVPWLKVEM